MAWQFVESSPAGLWTVWVGGACAPYPPLLARADGRDRRLLDRSLFVSTRDAAARLWAVDVSLRCPAVGLVVADGRRFDRAASRRVHLVATNHGKWALIARPAEERGEISAAHSRWLIRRAPSGRGGAAESVQPRWTVQLLRCKGVQPETAGRIWTLEWDHVHGALCISSPLADSTGPASARPDCAAAVPARPRSA
jgi:protein ImuA